MKHRDNIAKRFGLIGAGIGLTLFALFGLLNGSIIGGAIGLDIVNSVFHTAAGTTLLSRIIVGASMLAGVIVSGIVFVVVFSCTGWTAGYVIGILTEPKEAAAGAEAKPKAH